MLEPNNLPLTVLSAIPLESSLSKRKRGNFVVYAAKKRVIRSALCTDSTNAPQRARNQRIIKNSPNFGDALQIRLNTLASVDLAKQVNGLFQRITQMATLLTSIEWSLERMKTEKPNWLR